MMPPPRPLPRCRLYGLPIVNRFPPGCPLAEARAYRAVERMQASGYHRHDDGDPAGLDDIQTAHTCWGCVGHLLGDRRIQALRVRLADGRPKPAGARVAQGAQGAHIAESTPPSFSGITIRSRRTARPGATAEVRS